METKQVTVWLNITVLNTRNKRSKFHLPPVTCEPVRTIHLTPLEDGIVNESSNIRNILNIMNSIPQPIKSVTKFYHHQLDSLFKRHSEKSSDLIVARISGKFIPAEDLCCFSMRNCSKHPNNKKEGIQSHLKWREVDVGAPTDRNEQVDLQCSVVCENVDPVGLARLCGDTHPHLSSSDALVSCGRAHTAFTTSRSSDALRAGNRQRGAESCCSPGPGEGNPAEVALDCAPREGAESANSGLGNRDVDPSCGNEVTGAYHALEENSVVAVIPTVEVQDPSGKQRENHICPSESEMEKEAVSEAIPEDQSELVPAVHVPFSEQEPAREPHTAKQPPTKESGGTQSFNVLAHKESDKNKRKINGNKYSSKSKANNKLKMSKDFVVSDEITTKCNVRSQIFPSLELPQGKPETSLKGQKKNPQGDKGRFSQSAQKPKKQSLSCSCRSSAVLKKSVTPLSLPHVPSASDFGDLKYSDMFKQINSDEQGPGIYEMFGTPVYSHARELERHESRFYKSLCSAPSGTGTASTCRCTCPRGRESSRGRNTPKKTHPKPKQTKPGTKQKRKGSVPKDGSTKLSDSNTEQDKVVTSDAEFQTNTSRSTALSHGDTDHQFMSLEELSQSTKQNEIFSNSNLSTIKEVTLEQSLDSQDVSNHQRATPCSQDLQLSAEDCRDCVAARSSLLPTDQNIGVSQCRGEGDGGKGLESHQASFKSVQKCEASSFSDRLECQSPTEKSNHSWAKTPQNSILGNDLTQQSVTGTKSAKSPSFQTSQDTLSWTDKDVTDELLCCLAEELLMLEEKDINSARTKNTGSEMQSTPTEEEENMMSGDGAIVNNALEKVYCGLTSQGQLIAVKQVVLDTSDQLTTEKEYQKLHEEVDLLKTLKHVNIVTYLGTCLEHNILSIFMEFVPGGSISSIINRFGPLPEVVLRRYTRQILQGVAYLHANRVVHRDIKGSNVLLMPSGTVKLIDFGCARRLARPGPGGPRSEMLRSVRGTPFWMAPEVISGAGHGRKSDIWSVGCTVFEMATGKPPLASMGRIAAMFYIGAHRGLMPSLPQGFSGAAVDFVRACLTRNTTEF
ncbi:mitogen-activated protein kinase kinase kinase 19 [Pitangus sulphuratus]|nr:mitogen-activated protein kinase kinase kinase 19 [Pitangus sulphuratus]